MKTKVLKFLQDLPKTPEAQFNEALGLYRKSTGCSLTQVRFFNAAGFTKPNLANLLYELKKVHNISDAQIKSVKVKVKAIEPNATPVWAKGSKGNKARKAYCKEHGVKAASNKNKDLDAAIEAWMKNKKQKAKSEIPKAAVIPPVDPEKKKGEKEAS